MQVDTVEKSRSEHRRWAWAGIVSTKRNVLEKIGTQLEKNLNSLKMIHKDISRAFGIEMTDICDTHVYVHTTTRVHVQHVSMVQFDCVTWNSICNIRNNTIAPTIKMMFK